MNLTDKLATARREVALEIEHSTPLGASMFLNWVADRIVNVYGDNENMDYVLALRRIGAAIRSRFGIDNNA
jgi:hypothetical protein